MCFVDVNENRKWSKMGGVFVSRIKQTYVLTLCTDMSQTHRIVFFPHREISAPELQVDLGVRLRWIRAMCNEKNAPRQQE